MDLAQCILVIDDDESIREFISMALADEGYDVITASDGALALKLLRERNPVLILLDMRMPNMDGPTFLREYHELPEPHAPIIVLTAGRNTPASAIQIKADGLLAKPFDLNELIDLVTRYTSKKDGQASD